MPIVAPEWLDAALEEAESSWREGGIPIGAVLAAEDGTIVARGHNERVQTGDPTAHAEIVCLRRAGRRRDWKRLVLVSTLSPCAMCAGAVVLFKIPLVVIGENRTFLGAEDAMRASGVKLELVDDERCVAWMRRLQEEKPELWAEDIGE